MIKIKKILQNKTFIPVIFILLLAAFLRLYRIADYMTFLGDEGRDVLVVYNILHGKLTLLGPTASVGGFYLGPMYYYFMTPFLWLFNYNPVGPAVMVALFGIATVWLVYKVGSEFFDKTVGLIAAGLYAISSVAITYSRSSWNPNLMPFFSLLIIYSTYKAVLKNSWKLFIFVGFLFGIVVQLHYIELFLAIAIALYILLTTVVVKTKNIQGEIINVIKKYLLIGIGFLISFSPFIAFEVRNKFINTINIFTFIFVSGDTGGNQNFFGTIGNVFFQLFGRLIGHFPADEYLEQSDPTILLLWQITIVIIAITSIALFIKQFFSFKKQQKKFLQYSLILLWLVVGIGMFGFYKKPIYIYYLQFMFPIPFFLIGNMLSKIKLRSFVVIFTWYSIAAFLLFLITQATIPTGLFGNIVNFFNEDKNRIFYLAIPFFLYTVWTTLKDNNRVRIVLSTLVLFGIVAVQIAGIPFRLPANRQVKQMETIAKFVADKTNGDSFNFAIITGGNSDHAYRYFFTLWDKKPVTIDILDKDPDRLTVTDQLFVVCEMVPCGPLGYGTWEIAGFGRAEIAEEWDVSVVKVYKLKHYIGKEK